MDHTSWRQIREIQDSIKSASFILSLDCGASFIRIVYLSSHSLNFQFKFVFIIYSIIIQT